MIERKFLHSNARDNKTSINPATRGIKLSKEILLIYKKRKKETIIFTHKNKPTAKSILSSRKGVRKMEFKDVVNPVTSGVEFHLSGAAAVTRVPEPDPRSEIVVLFARYRKREVNLMISLVHVP